MSERKVDPDFEEFLRQERDEILKYKWIVSEKAGKDLGNEACMEWIRNHAKEFRAMWDMKNFNLPFGD